jgi:hypothetical protein
MLDYCIRCGSSIRLRQSDFENSDPVFLADGRAICGHCYRNMSSRELKQIQSSSSYFFSSYEL